MRIIVVGSGGREHAISWKLAQSPLVESVIVVPGNGGTQNESKCENIPIEAGANGEGLPPCVKIARDKNCDFAVIGPEDPLAQGLADEFWKAGIPCAGASKAAARLEASKDFAKKFMKAHGVSCAASETFCDVDAAKSYVRAHGAPVVIKADGLAAGKGVTVAASVEGAERAIDDIMKSGRVGDAGKKIVVEDYLQGVEISVLAAVSVTPDLAREGKAAIVPFLPARDHKRLLDGAKGPNTGGMGAVCPPPDLDDGWKNQFEKNILAPTLDGIIQEKFDYRGFIFFGVMLTKSGPALLEYNVRLGDPETQAVLPLMDFDFARMCAAIADGSLKSFELKWKSGFVVSPCVVSCGYPGAYEKGKPISIDRGALEKSGAKIFVAGAKRSGGGLATSGGRVLAASAFGETFDEARRRAYQAAGAVRFDGAFFRNDIGLPGAAESGDLS